MHRLRSGRSALVCRLERFRSVTLSPADLASLDILGGDHSFEGDSQLLRLGLQAYSLGIAWEVDPYFGLSISRVDPSVLHPGPEPSNAAGGDSG